MGLLKDIKVLYHLAFKPVRGNDHASRLESFYAGQAEGYDDFRKRLLRGREEMYRAIEPPPHATWVDMGGGTGANLEHIIPKRDDLSRVYVVDLSPSLLAVARRLIESAGWRNVEPIEADATTFKPANGPAQVVTFSYSLTMIPDWFAAIENARDMLEPGGIIGVVDFYISRKYPRDGLKKHSRFTRGFWPAWFASDNVFPSPDHVPFLHRHFEPLHFHEEMAPVPYLPFARTPYYWFVGRKR